MKHLKIPLLLLCAHVNMPAHAQNTLPKDPNVLFIVMDDFDVLDMTKYKALYYSQAHINGLDPTLEINTPNLDNFFDDSLVFSNFYTNGANCSPTRGSLLTGLFPSDLGFYRAVPQDSERGIYDGIPFLTEILKESNTNYQTATVGKWNVGHKATTSVGNETVFTPQANGFDYSFCTVGCNVPDNANIIDFDSSMKWDIGNVYHRTHIEVATPLSFPEYKFTSIGVPPTPASNVCQITNGVNDCDPQTPYNDDQYLVELNTNTAANFINQRDTSKPFFMNLWYWLPHGGAHVPLGMDNPSLYSNYKLRHDKPVPEDKIIHQLDGCQNTTTDLSPHDHTCNTRLGEYSAMVTRLDQSIGDIVDLAKTIPNTLIIIVSDNGGASGSHVLRDSYSTPNAAFTYFGLDDDLIFKGSKNEVYERGVRAPLMVYWTNDANPDQNNTYDNRLTSRIENDVVLSRELFTTVAKLTGFQLTNSSQYGRDIVSILKENAEPQYVNNSRDEWLVSEHRPVFYENNVLNQPNRSYVTTANASGCVGDNEGEYQDFAVVQNDWKFVNVSSRWDSGGFTNCDDETNELFELKPDLSDGMKYETNDELSNQPFIADYLQLLRKRWHQSIGLIEYDKTSLPNNNQDINLLSTSDHIDIPFNDRLNISEGHFSFSSYVNPVCGSAGNNGAIAVRQNANSDQSWDLRVVNGQLHLLVRATHSGENHSAPSPLEDLIDVNSGTETLNCGQENHVAFSILGGRSTGPLIRLFLNGNLVGTKVTTTANKPTNNLDEWMELNHTDPDSPPRPYVRNVHEGLRIGGYSNDSLVATISQPVMYVNPFTNEDIVLQSANRENLSSFSNSQRAYGTETMKGALFSDAMYTLEKQPVLGDNRAVVELDAETDFGANGEISFASRVYLDDVQPSNESIIGRQIDTDDGNALGWIFKLSKQTNPNEYQLRLNLYPGGCTSGPLTSGSNFINTQQHHQVGFNVVKTENNGVVKSTAKLFLNGMVIDEQELSANCQISGNKIFVGNRYNNCDSGNSKNCDMVAGTIDQVNIEPRVKYSETVTDGAKKSGSIVSFAGAGVGGQDNPYALLTPKINFDSSAGEYNFSTVANLLTPDITTHATLARQFRDISISGNSRGSNWILKYNKVSSNPSQYQVRLNTFFEQNNTAVPECVVLVTSGSNYVRSFEEHHIAFTIKDNDQITLYLDGKEVGSGPTCGTGAFVSAGLNTDDFIVLGDQFVDCDPTDSNDPICHPFEGYIYTPRIWTNTSDLDYIKWDATYNYPFE